MELNETGALSESSTTSETTAGLMPLLDPPLNNEEMAMSKEDFDHLLFDNPISTTMEESFGVPMNVEDTLVTGCPPVELESNDSGFCDDQTMMSTDTDFESGPVSPISSTLYISQSQSPSSESGIEEDEDDDQNIETLDVNQALSSLSNAGETQNSLSTLLAKQPSTEACTVPQVSSVVDAYEELKQLLYTVASHSQTLPSPTSTKTTMSGLSSLPTIPSTTNINLLSSISTLPVSTQANNTSLAMLTTSENGTAEPSTNSSERLSQMVEQSQKTSNDSKCVRRTRKAREKPKLVIIDEPEENYRARYESEGCRGPIHGSSDNSYPTIKVSGHNGPVWITVYLVTSSGLPHYHSIHGPGSTKVPCKEITLPGGIPAVQLMVDPDSKMTAVMDSLSIRRLRNWEGDKELKKRGIDPRTWKRERKEGRLLFQAEIPGENGQPEIKLTCKSRIFQCSSSGPTGSPEIWWTSRTEGSVEGKEEMGLIGKKFPTDLKVRFYANLPSGKSSLFSLYSNKLNHISLFK